MLILLGNINLRVVINFNTEVQANSYLTLELNYLYVEVSYGFLRHFEYKFPGFFKTFSDLTFRMTCQGQIQAL